MDWILLTIFAATFQTLRTAVQKTLKTKLSTHAITFTRFGFGFPFAVLYLSCVLYFFNYSLPAINLKFISFCLLGSIFQIWGTSALVSAFSYKNFAVSSTYAKTEALLAAVLGVIFFKDYLSWSGFGIICIGMSGVVLISLGKKTLDWRGSELFQKGPILGLASGLFFALTSLSIRHASLSLDSGNFLIQAAFTLVVMVSIQMLILVVYLGLYERDQFVYLKTSWKGSTIVGLTAILGSIGWFTAMTLQNVAYVKMVGQVELLVSVLISIYYFKERIFMKELVGMMVVVASIVSLIWLL